MGLDLLQIFNLTKCPARKSLRRVNRAGSTITFCKHCRAAVFLPDEDSLLRSSPTEFAQCSDDAVPGCRDFAARLPQARFDCLAPQTETFSAPGDGDVKHGFNLPEVFIQRPAEIGKALIVNRRKGNFGRLWFQRRSKASH